MKKLSQIAMVLLLSVVSASAGIIVRIEYSAGEWCWYEGSSCTVEIEFEFGIAPNGGDKPQIEEATGNVELSYAIARSGQLTGEEAHLPHLTHYNENTGEITVIPRQTATWSQEHQGYLVAYFQHGQAN